MFLFSIIRNLLCFTGSYSNDVFLEPLSLDEYKPYLYSIIRGILKENIHKFLKNKKEVKAYKTDIFNPGMTIIELV